MDKRTPQIICFSIIAHGVALFILDGQFKLKTMLKTVDVPQPLSARLIIVKPPIKEIERVASKEKERVTKTALEKEQEVKQPTPLPQNASVKIKKRSKPPVYSRPNKVRATTPSASAIIAASKRYLAEQPQLENDKYQINDGRTLSMMTEAPNSHYYKPVFKSVEQREI